MQIAIPLFDRFTALDAVGPYEVLSHLPGASVVFVAAERGVVAASWLTTYAVVSVSVGSVPSTLRRRGDRRVRPPRQRQSGR